MEDEINKLKQEIEQLKALLNEQQKQALEEKKMKEREELINQIKARIPEIKSISKDIPIEHLKIMLEVLNNSTIVMGTEKVTKIIKKSQKSRMNTLIIAIGVVVTAIVAYLLKITLMG